jgi:hypothetical protein
MKILIGFLITIIGASSVKSQSFPETVEFRGILGDSVMLLTLENGRIDTNEFYTRFAFIRSGLFERARKDSNALQEMKQKLHQQEKKWWWGHTYSMNNRIKIIFSPDVDGKPIIVINGNFNSNYDTITALITINNNQPQSLKLVKDSLTYEDHIRQFMREFKSAILSNDRSKVIAMAGHAKVHVEKTRIKNVRDFQKKYDKIFSPQFIERIRKFTIDDTLWEHNGYYEFGEQGDFWIGVGGLFLEELELWVETINGNE